MNVNGRLKYQQVTLATFQLDNNDHRVLVLLERGPQHEPFLSALGSTAKQLKTLERRTLVRSHQGLFYITEAGKVVLLALRYQQQD